MREGVVRRTAMPPGKRIPQRTCLGCRTTKPKRELIRLVRTAAGRVEFDTTGKARGRGAYLCPNVVCAGRALQASTLNRALRVSLDDAALAGLRAWAEQLDEQNCTRAGPPQAENVR